MKGRKERNVERGYLYLVSIQGRKEMNVGKGYILKKGGKGM